jgi:hypothetical protein
VSQPIPINTERFHHEGRGPELKRIHWSGDGTQLVAIDYFNPEDRHDSDAKHVRFRRAQAVMVSPEETIGASLAHIADHRPAAMFDLGQSEWLATFAPTHLEQCSHFQLLFYDHLVDVICEGVECLDGEFDPVVAG